MPRAPLPLALLLAAAASAAAASPLGQPRQLTFEGVRAGEGYFSAGGTQMIFQSEREPGNPFYQIYLMDLETGDVRRLSTGTGKTTCGWIHPSGERALFASTQGDPEAEAKQEAELEARASGEQRRYAWDYDPAFDITEIDLDTGAYRTLAPAEGYDAEGAYSPDGSRIVFASNRHAYEAGAEVDPERLARDPAYYMDLYVMNADGTGLRRLTDAPGYDGGPFWSADGERITWRRFGEKGATAEIYTMNADGTDERRITDLGVMSWAPFFHPSGEYIVFATSLQGFANFELYMVDDEGLREPVRVTDREGFDGLPTFHPDGELISWTSNATPKRRSQIFLAPWDHAAALAALEDAPLAERAEAPATPMPEMEATATAIAAADLRLHLEALASDAMEGRLTGTAGEAAAIAYLEAAFRAIGLEGAAPGGGYAEPFDFTSGVALAEGNALTVTRGEGRLEAEIDRDWRPLAFSETGSVGAAEAVFAGYGIVAPERAGQPALDSYEGLDVEGKWVVVWRGLPGDIAAGRRSYLARFADLRHRAAMAKARGAAGIVFAAPPRLGLDSALPRLSMRAVGGRSGLPALALGPGLAEALLAGLPEGLRATAEAGEPAGAALEGVEIAAHISLERQRAEGRNLLARLDLDGLPPGEGRPPLMIGAHLDHLGRGASGSLAGPDEAGEIHNGADDNASGLAALLEVAQYLAGLRAEGRLEGARDIVFAAWSGEELGLLGVSHHTDAAAERAGAESLADLVSAYINLDMVGRLRDELVISGLGSSPVWAREIERRNAVVGLPIVTSETPFLPTDATELYIAEVPVLALFTGSHAEYHTPRDTADLINYEGLEKIARFTALVARSRALDPEEPAYVALDRPERSGARRMGGVFLGTIPDYAQDGVEGVLLSGVVKGGPAEAAGLGEGDVVVELAGTELTSLYDYVGALNGLKPGEAVEVVVERGGERVSLEIVPGRRE